MTARPGATTGMSERLRTSEACVRNMSTPKITLVRIDHEGSWWTYSVDGFPYWADDLARLTARLAESGQRITIPDDAGPGWWGVPENVPTPEPISERWINCYASGGAVAYTTQAQADRHRQSGCLVVIHVWTDADGVDRVEIERVP